MRSPADVTFGAAHLTTEVLVAFWTELDTALRNALVASKRPLQESLRKDGMQVEALTECASTFRAHAPKVPLQRSCSSAGDLDLAFEQQVGGPSGHRDRVGKYWTGPLIDPVVSPLAARQRDRRGRLRVDCNHSGVVPSIELCGVLDR
jgi:hypothetical protein